MEVGIDNLAMTFASGKGFGLADNRPGGGDITEVEVGKPRASSFPPFTGLLFVVTV
jgi:hypothetical protein